MARPPATPPADEADSPYIARGPEPLVFEDFTGGLWTEASRPGVGEKQAYWCDGWFPLGIQNLRTLPGIGEPIYGELPTPVTTALEFTVQPAQTLCGIAIAPTTVDFTDLTTSGDITIALGTNPTGAVLSGTLTQTGISVEFDDLTLDKEGTGYTLVASSPGATSAESAPFDIASQDFSFCWRAGSAGLFGVPSQLLKNSTSMGLTNAPNGLLMFWWYPVNGLSTPLFADSLDDLPNTGTAIYFSPFEAGFTLNAGGLFAGSFDADFTTLIGSWHQIIMSWNSVTQVFQCYLDGVEIVGSGFTATWTGAPANVAYSGRPSYAIGAYQGSGFPQSDFFFGIPAAFYDLSNPAKLAALRTIGGAPVDLTGGIAGVTSNVYLHGNEGDFGANLGTGGAFAEVGTVMNPTSSTPWP